MLLFRLKKQTSKNVADTAFKDIYILNIKNTDYCCIISGISKSEATKLLQNIDSFFKKKTLWPLFMDWVQLHQG